MSEERTITVTGYFGDKQMTKEEYVKVWREHVGELLRIDYSDEWTREVTAIADKVIKRVEGEFDRMYEAQHAECP
jgi:hypothetical protein